MKWAIGAILLLVFFGAGFAVLAEECVAAGEQCYQECCISLGYNWSGEGCTTPEDVDASDLRVECAYCFDTYHECIGLAEDMQEPQEEDASYTEQETAGESQYVVQQEENEPVNAAQYPAPGLEDPAPEGCAIGFVLLVSLLGVSSCRVN